MPQRAVEPFDVIGLAGELGEGAVLGEGNDTCVDCVLIRIEQGALLIHGGNLVPQGFGALATAVPDMEGDDLTGRGVQRNPDPLLVLLLPHKAPELVQLGLQPLYDHRWGATW